MYSLQRHQRRPQHGEEDASPLAQGWLFLVDDDCGYRRGDWVRRAYRRCDGGLDVCERGREEERAEAERAEARGEGEERLARQENAPRSAGAALLLPEPQRERDGEERHAAPEGDKKRRKAVRDERLVEKQPRRPKERRRDGVGDAGPRDRHRAAAVPAAEQRRPREGRQRPRRRRSRERRAEYEMRGDGHDDGIRARYRRAARDAEPLHREKQENVADNVVAEHHDDEDDRLERRDARRPAMEGEEQRRAADQPARRAQQRHLESAELMDAAHHHRRAAPAETRHNTHKNPVQHQNHRPRRKICTSAETRALYYIITGRRKIQAAAQKHRTRPRPGEMKRK